MSASFYTISLIQVFFLREQKQQDDNEADAFFFFFNAIDFFFAMPESGSLSVALCSD